MEVGSRSESLELTGEKLVAEKRLQQVVHRSRGHAEMRRQTAVESMGDLVEIIADAPQLGEQCGIHAMKDGLGYLERSLGAQDQYLAIGGEREADLRRSDREACVILVRHADIDLAVASLRDPRRCSRHCAPLKSWVRGAGTAT